MAKRTRYGFERIECACETCKAACRFMPAMVIPSDLNELVGDDDPFEWAEANLVVSPGLTMAAPDGTERHEMALVMAGKADGSCVMLTDDGRCSIHDRSPFGCAFFATCEGKDTDESEARKRRRIADEIVEDRIFSEASLYRDLMAHLRSLGRVDMTTPDEKILALSRHMEAVEAEEQLCPSRS